MKRRRTDKSGARISEALLSRIIALCDLVWQGNRSRMSRDLGIDQAAMSRILAAKQQPGAKMLEKLAAWEGLDVGWLFTGKGEPLLREGMRAGIGLYLPLFDQILAGPPTEHKDRLTGLSYPVAAAHFSETAYWYRVPLGAPVTNQRMGVLGGDLLLMESDTSYMARPAMLLDRFCGIQSRNRQLLGHVNGVPDVVDDDYEAAKVDMFGVSQITYLVISGDQKLAKQGVSDCLSLTQVTCVCRKLERGFGRPT